MSLEPWASFLEIWKFLKELMQCLISEQRSVSEHPRVRGRTRSKSELGDQGQPGPKGAIRHGTWRSWTRLQAVPVDLHFESEHKSTRAVSVPQGLCLWHLLASIPCSKSTCAVEGSQLYRLNLVQTGGHDGS